MLEMMMDDSQVFEDAGEATETALHRSSESRIPLSIFFFFLFSFFFLSFFLFRLLLVGFGQISRRHSPLRCP